MTTRFASLLPVLLATLCVVAPPACAQAPETDPADEPEYFFYHGREVGAEMNVDPFHLLANGGLGILQMENRSNRLADVQWRNGWKNVWKNLLDPFGSIQARGWWEFISSEIIPVSINSGNAQYWPNYTNHLIGGGMSYRQMREWYRYRGFGHERTLSVATMAVYHLLNETVEMNDRTGWRVDPVADIYIFDVAGILLFESDRVSRFFSRTLHLSDWSYQPLWDPRRGTLENNGMNYMMRWRLPWAPEWLLFYHWGNSGELGLSRHLGGGHHLSWGAGWVAKNLTKVDEFSETAELAQSFGLFYDRDDNLLASLIFAQNRDNRWRLNLYPGLFEVYGFRPGFTFTSTQTGDFLMGLTFGTQWLPLGIGLQVGNDR